jgi:hypothetical protein
MCLNTSDNGWVLLWQGALARATPDHYQNLLKTSGCAALMAHHTLWDDTGAVQSRCRTLMCSTVTPQS